MKKIKICISVFLAAVLAVLAACAKNPDKALLKKTSFSPAGSTVTAENESEKETENVTEKVTENESNTNASESGRTVLPDGNIEFLANVTDIAGNTVTVTPMTSGFEGSYDEITFSLNGLDDLGDIKGSGVYITYNGEVMETYPPMINAISWREAGTEPTYDSTVFIQINGGAKNSDYSAKICSDGALQLNEVINAAALCDSVSITEPEYTIENHISADQTQKGEVSFEQGIFNYNGVSYKLNSASQKLLKELISPAGCKNEQGSERMDEYFTNTVFKIYAIYNDFIMLEPVIPMFGLVKANGVIAQDFNINDTVTAQFTEIYVNAELKAFECSFSSLSAKTVRLDPTVAYKPVIYLYPEQKTEVNVKLTLDGEMLASYPKYKDGWCVTATPDGTIIDADGSTYNYLFWEARLNASYNLLNGFCVKGKDTKQFLTEKLKFMGLNQKEIYDFTEFWVPIMQNNAYNFISFQQECYTDCAKLNISPAPDNIIRVFMVSYALDDYVKTNEQSLIEGKRDGFTAVEWGGQIIDNSAE